jgi:rSAM/selenodomain-associated transferase 2
VCVSVVIPVLNEAEVLPALILQLRRCAAEIVFVDGGSHDASQALLAASGFRWFIAPRGRAVQMNAGVEAATGDVLMFLHADTTLPRTAISQVRAATRAGFVGGAFAVRLDSSRPLVRFVGAVISWRSRLTGVATGDQVLFATRSSFDQVGGFPSLPLFEDVDFARRLRRAGPTTQLRPAVRTSARRWEQRGSLVTILKMWILRSLYYAGVSPRRLARHYGDVR